MSLVTMSHQGISRTKRTTKDKYEDDARIENARHDLYRQMDTYDIVFS
jgi:hypothetical protein